MFNIFRRKENSQNNKIGTLADRLEGAKQKLIADLEKNGMEFLVKSMACNDDYSELIEERRNIARSYGSEDRVWWYAYRRSDKLSSPEEKEKLLELLSNDSYSDHKKHIYHCLSNICRNTNDKELFNWLIDQLQQEEEEKIRVSILCPLEAVVKDSGYNIEPIKLLVKEGTAYENHAAIKALS